MSKMMVFDERGERPPKILTDQSEMTKLLRERGVRFEQWECPAALTDDSTSEEIIEAYRDKVDRLMRESGFQSADVISLHPEHPDKDSLRDKFLNEHTHSDDEVRFFVDGEGLFYLHFEDRVYGLLCEKGDLISVPANTYHWFDMGPKPSFKCVRLFTSPDGWVAHMTGDMIAERYPRHGE